jgi:superoxide dismutase, Cu-Zn family
MFTINSRLLINVSLTCLLLLNLAACSRMRTQNKNPSVSAVAELYPVGGSGTQAVIQFHQRSNEIYYTGAARGLSGVHALHIHEATSCEGAANGALGGHLNPSRARHGHPLAQSHHLGGLTNIDSDTADRFHGIIEQATLTSSNMFSSPSWTLNNQNIVGHAIAIKARADDYTSQPDGQSGAVIACGVIRLK